jgi:hypothetical protein
VETIRLLAPPFQRELKVFQVNFFENEAGNSMGSIFEPGLDRDFTIALQDILQNQTNLTTG